MKLNPKDERFEKQKEFLNRYKVEMKKIARLQEKLISVESSLNTVNQEDKNNLEIEKRELERRILNLANRAQLIKSEIHDRIDAIDNSKALENIKFAEVLEQFFLSEKTFAQIAESMNYTERYVIRLYSAAVRAIGGFADE